MYNVTLSKGKAELWEKCYKIKIYFIYSNMITAETEIENKMLIMLDLLCLLQLDCQQKIKNVRFVVSTTTWLWTENKEYHIGCVYCNLTVNWKLRMSDLLCLL